MKLVFQAEADHEFQSGIKFYKREAGLAIAQAFVAEVERVASLLREYPEFGTLLHERSSSSVRRFPLKRFPYSLVYRVQNDVIRILAVAHQHRKPGYWQGRK